MFHYKRNKKSSARVVFYYVVYSIINEIILYLLRIDPLRNNKIEAGLVWSFTVIEFIFFGLYFYLILTKKTNKKALLFAAIAFAITAAINLIINIKGFDKNYAFDTIPVSVSAITFIIFSIVFLFERIQFTEIEFIYERSNFWIIIGIMIYFSGTFFLFLQYSELSDQEKDSFWIINWFCILLKNIFFSIGFYLKEEKRISIIKSSEPDFPELVD